MRINYKLFITLFFLAVSLVGTAQDTLRYEDFIKTLKNKRGEKTETETTPPKDKKVEPEKAEERKEKRPDSMADTERAFGVFESLISESLTSSLFLIDQGYVGQEANGDEIIVSEDGHRPIELGVMVGDRLLTLSKTLTPWATDPNERYVNGQEDELHFRRLENYPDRWSKESDYLSEKIGDSGLAYYDKVKGGGGNLTLATNDDCTNCVLLLATVGRGDSPRNTTVKLRYERIFPDWDDGRAEIQLPRMAETIIGGIVLDIASSTGSMEFKVAGMLATNDEESYLISVPDAKEVLPERGKKVKKSSSGKEKKKSKKVKKRKS